MGFVRQRNSTASEDKLHRKKVNYHEIHEHAKNEYIRDHYPHVPTFYHVFLSLFWIHNE
eukprot:Pgem_evm1s16209